MGEKRGPLVLSFPPSRSYYGFLMVLLIDNKNYKVLFKRLRHKAAHSL
jgi:hypothetical protein